MDNIYNETKFILNKYGITANKKLGQNFLINEAVINEIIKSADINKEDLVIEIGPGLGTLTSRLLEKAGKVIAVELDNRMVNILEDRFKLYDNFELINDDILKVDLHKIIKNNVGTSVSDEPGPQRTRINVGNDDLVAPYTTNESNNVRYTPVVLKNVKIVANLPYYITTPIIMKLLEEKLNIDSITVMIQKEVADRLIAIPGEKLAGAITYSVYYYAKSQKIIDVENNSFIPEPNVTSSVIKLDIRKQFPVKVKDEELMFKIIKQSFTQRRKTLVNALSNLKIFDTKEQIITILKKLNIDEKVRGEALSIQEFASIANCIDYSKL